MNKLTNALTRAKLRARSQQAPSPWPPTIPGALPPAPPSPTPPTAENPTKVRQKRVTFPEKRAEPSEKRNVDVAELPIEVYQAVLADVLKSDGRSRRRLPSKKRRRYGMSVSMSQEEHEIITQHCEGLGVSVSDWVRRTLFRAIGQSVPKRPHST